jgi:hypothetical protein
LHEDWRAVTKAARDDAKQTRRGLPIAQSPNATKTSNRTPEGTTRAEPAALCNAEKDLVDEKTARTKEDRDH